MNGRGVVQEFGLISITLNRPDLEFNLGKVGYLFRYGLEAHSLWDVF